MSHQCQKRKVDNSNSEIMAISFDKLKRKVDDGNDKIMAISFDRILTGQKKNWDIPSCFHESRTECPINAE